MRLEEFLVQVNRLKSQWPNSYGKERQAVLFKALEKTEMGEFVDAVTYCLANSRTAPLYTELNEAIEQCKRRDNDLRLGMQQVSFQKDLASRADTSTADPEFVRACMKLLADFQSRKITREQFLQGYDWLETTAKQISRHDSRMKQAGEKDE